MVFHPVFRAHIGASTKFGSRTAGPFRWWCSQQNFLHIQGSNPRSLVKNEALPPVHHDTYWWIFHFIRRDQQLLSSSTKNNKITRHLLIKKFIYTRYLYQKHINLPCLNQENYHKKVRIDIKLLLIVKGTLIY